MLVFGLILSHLAVLLLGAALHSRIQAAEATAARTVAAEFKEHVTDVVTAEVNKLREELKKRV